MRGDRSGTPAATVVSRVADGGRQLADYLDQHGPDGVLRDVQDFARRRPGAFLATALAAGFVVGRLGKGVAKADPNAGNKPTSDSYTSELSPAGYEASYPGNRTGYSATDPAFQAGTGAAYPTAGNGTAYPTAGTGTAYPTAGTDAAYQSARTDPAYPTAGTDPTYQPAGAGYETTGVEYASTGTGTPLVVEEEYPITRPETRP